MAALGTRRSHNRELVPHTMVRRTGTGDAEKAHAPVPVCAARARSRPRCRPRSDPVSAALGAGRVDGGGPRERPVLDAGSPDPDTTRMARGARPCQHDQVTELPVDRPEADLERRRGAELTPHERATRRRNRRLISYILVPSLLVGTAALLAALIASRGGPSIRPLSVPPGYQSVSDGYFAYAVPSSWSQSEAYTDDVGDLDTQGTTGWAAEHVDARADAPKAGETPPSSSPPSANRGRPRTRSGWPLRPAFRGQTWPTGIS